MRTSASRRTHLGPVARVGARRSVEVVLPVERFRGRLLQDVDRGGEGSQKGAFEHLRRLSHHVEPHQGRPLFPKGISVEHRPVHCAQWSDKKANKKRDKKNCSLPGLVTADAIATRSIRSSIPFKATGDSGMKSSPRLKKLKFCQGRVVCEVAAVLVIRDAVVGGDGGAGRSRTFLPGA